MAKPPTSLEVPGLVETVRAGLGLQCSCCPPRPGAAAHPRAHGCSEGEGPTDRPGRGKGTRPSAGTEGWPSPGEGATDPAHAAARGPGHLSPRAAPTHPPPGAAESRRLPSSYPLPFLRAPLASFALGLSGAASQHSARFCVSFPLPFPNNPAGASKLSRGPQVKVGSRPPAEVRPGPERAKGQQSQPGKPHRSSSPKSLHPSRPHLRPPPRKGPAPPPQGPGPPGQCSRLLDPSNPQVDLGRKPPLGPDCLPPSPRAPLE
ncbi:basic salivary proline-rich protein 3-like [Ursus americanus]|uniref:basic salivary proline-rich protein 3-like n=1 Tax=Ursus americanus TaxID=9643 RepID=UPI001E679A23|nr:basic salivary proline-rich protein 3-like [Ursus americanus]